ncbi:MAG: hypothetical protein ACEPOW_14570 [Bacteroidales bacterium]
MRQITLILLLVLTGCAVCAQTDQDSRPTIKEYINKEIRIVDRFAGQSITLVKENKDYYIVRKFFGSGVPVVADAKYKVAFNSDYQITFSELEGRTETEKMNQKPKEEFILTVGNNGLDLYLNGLKILTK